MSRRFPLLLAVSWLCFGTLAAGCSARRGASADAPSVAAPQPAPAYAAGKLGSAGPKQVDDGHVNSLEDVEGELGRAEGELLALLADSNPDPAAPSLTESTQPALRPALQPDPQPERSGANNGPSHPPPPAPTAKQQGHGAVVRRCSLACRALGSMDRSAQRICQMAGEGERCTSAQQRVGRARQRVERVCAACAG